MKDATCYCIFREKNICVKVALLLCVHLSGHVHQQYSCDGSLSLTVSLLRTIESVSLQHAEQVLLPTWTIYGRVNSEMIWS